MKGREEQIRLLLGVLVMVIIIGWSGSAIGQASHTPPQSPLGNCIACVLDSFFSPYGYNSVFGASCDQFCGVTPITPPSISGHVEETRALCTFFKPPFPPSSPLDLLTKVVSGLCGGGIVAAVCGPFNCTCDLKAPLGSSQGCGDFLTQCEAKGFGTYSCGSGSSGTICCCPPSPGCL